MHECFSLQDWARELSESSAKPEVASCARCSAVHGDLLAWARAVESCRDCWGHRDELSSIDERLDCPHCLATLRSLHRTLEELEHFDPSILAELVPRERLYLELTALAPSEQAKVARSDARFHSWALCQRFVSEAQALWHRDPRLAADRAEVGAAIADRLDPLPYHPQWVADLRAKAHGYLANCHRILASFAEAESELATAYQNLGSGVGSGLWDARIRSLEASLRSDQGQYAEAASLLDRIATFYEKQGDSFELARTQLKRSSVYDFLGQHAAAAEECARASDNLDPETSPTLSSLARQNLVHFLVQSGQIARARELFARLPPTRERLHLVRRKWIEAGLLRAEGKHDHAIQAYEAARKGFAAADLVYDVALVSLDQALVAFEMGDGNETDRLVGAASLLLIEAGARKEALTASQMLLATVERGTVDPGIFAAIHRRVAALRPY